MHKVITMSDSNYFDTGKLLLKTRDRVKADFILYGPDLTKSQISILKKNNIEYNKVDPYLYKTQMQFLKFSFLRDQINADVGGKYTGFSLVDFDTFFINDWSSIFNYDFDFGITIRNNMVKDKVLRAYTNGGVVFAKRTSTKLLDFARKTVVHGESIDLVEYDRIWNTLETGRPKHKTHYRDIFRWWVDQVFLSSLALNYFEKYGYCKVGLKPIIFEFNKTKVGMFGCNYYNVLDSKPRISYKKNIYIRHLKTVGRNILGVNKTIEKLEK